MFELSNTCRKLYVDVAAYDEVEVKSNRMRSARHPVSAGASCKAFFETSLPGHGLCIRVYGIMLGTHAQLDFQTGPYGPERVSTVRSVPDQPAIQCNAIRSSHVHPPSFLSLSVINPFRAKEPVLFFSLFFCAFFYI